MMDEEREIALFDESDMDMEIDKVDATSHNRETVKNALERKLSNRAAKQELMDKNILHGYTTSPALHGPMSSLERRKKNDELQKKIRQRPDQDELVQMNILKNTTSVHPSLQANQTQLKRAVTANSLSQKIASRPGPLSLIQKGILNPTNNCLVGAVKQLPLPAPGEELEEGGVAATPLASQQVLQQKKRQQQRHSVATMGGAGISNQSSQVSSQTTSPFHSGEWNKLTSPIPRSMSADVAEDGHEERLRKGSSSSSIPSPPEFINLESPAHSPSGSVGVRSPPTSLRNFQAGRNMNKIPTVSPKLCKKQIKSKREKFRFHIYQPPNQKRGMKDIPQKQRSPYSLLVQQQQILLQLQVLQQQHPEMMNTGINFPPIPSDCSPQQHMQILLQTLHKMTENRSSISSSIPTSKSSPPFSSESIAHKDNSPLSMMANSQQQHKMSTSLSFTNESLIQCDNGKKVKFEDVRVNNLKEACKEKKLVVSGKKAELVERLLEHNNGALPASVMERKDIGPEGRTTTPQELPSIIPTTSPTIFKFPSNQADNVTAPIRTNYMHIKKIQDKFDEDNQKKKLNYISGNNYSGPIAPMPDMVPARYTVQQHQKPANQAAMSIAVGINSSVVNNSLSHMYTGESHQPLIKKKSLSEPSSPILSPSSPLSLLTQMISGDNSSLLDSSPSQQQQLDRAGGVKQHFTAHQQRPSNGVAGMFNSGSNPTRMTNDDEILFRTKATAPPPNHRKSMPVLPPYISRTGASVKRQSTMPGGAPSGGDYQYSDGSDLYGANGLPVVDPSEQLMDIGTDPSLMGILDVNGEEGYQNNTSQSNKVVTDGNPLDFLSMSNPFVIARSGVELPSPKDVPPPPPYTSNSHPTANPDLSWMTNYGASPVHTSMAFLSQSLSTTGSAVAERYHNSEHNKRNLNSIQPFLDSDLPVPNLDLFSSADTEKYLSMSM